MTLSLPLHRRTRVWTVGISAVFVLYGLAMVIAEPLRGFAATSQSTTVVSLTVAATISNSCTATLNIGTITGTGDSATSGNWYGDGDYTRCIIITNNSTGYTFGWLVSTGTGAAGARTGTGHMNGFVAGNRIAPFKPTTASTPITFTVSSTDARWAGRLSSSGSSTNTGAGMHWGADSLAGTDRWLNVATGSTVNIAKRNTQTYQYSGSDAEVVGFRAKIGASYLQPTDTYKVTVTFTATTNP